LPAGLVGGRLLVSVPQDSLSDGASYNEINGYIDCDDMSPWDTWVCCEETAVVSWVPAALIAIVNDGIEVNASGCLQWLNEDKW
jgi:hypothetical protein